MTLCAAWSRGPEIKPADDGASHSITRLLSPRRSFLPCLVVGILTSLAGNLLSPLFLQTEPFFKERLGKRRGDDNDDDDDTCQISGAPSHQLWLVLNILGCLCLKFVSFVPWC